MAKNKRKIKQIVLISLFIILIYCIVFSYYSPFDFYFTGEPPLIKESKHLVYHYFPFSKQVIQIDKIIKSGEESLLYVCKLFEMEPPDEKIHIYLFRNHTELTKHKRDRYKPVGAQALLPTSTSPPMIITSTARTAVMIHESIHICCFYKWGDRGKSPLSEATAYSQTYKKDSIHPLLLDYIVQHFLKNGELENIFKDNYYLFDLCALDISFSTKNIPELIKKLPTAFASFSFAGFLFKEYGLDKYGKLYKSSVTIEDLEKIYGKTFLKLRDEWKSYILSLPDLSQKKYEEMVKVIRTCYDNCNVKAGIVEKAFINQYELQNSIEENFIKGKYFDAAKDSISLFYNYLHFGLGEACNDTEAKLFRAKYFLSASLEERDIFKQKILPLLQILTLNLIITPYYYLIYSRYIYFIIAAVLTILIIIILWR